MFCHEKSNNNSKKLNKNCFLVCVHILEMSYVPQRTVASGQKVIRIE